MLAGGDVKDLVTILTLGYRGKVTQNLKNHHLQEHEQAKTRQQTKEPIVIPDNTIVRHLSPGPTPDCPDCPENEHGEDDGFFSWSSCLGCPEPEGGLRYAAHVVFVDHSYDHINICGDCLLAVANEDTEGRTDRILNAYKQPN